MMKISDFIADLYGSRRAFRAEKRRQVREVERALGNLRNGCAYLPNGTVEVDQITAAVKVLRQITSVKEWGR